MNQLFSSKMGNQPSQIIEERHKNKNEVDRFFKKLEQIGIVS